MMRHIGQRLARVRFADPASLNAFIGVYTACWGAWLLVWASTFQLPSYREFLRAHVPEPLLGVVMVGLGAFLFAATLAGSERWRRVALLQHVAFWSFLSAFFLRGSPQGFVGPSAMLFAAQALWGYWAVHYQGIRDRVGA